MDGTLLWLAAAALAGSPVEDWRWVTRSDEGGGRTAFFIDKASLERDGDRISFVELAISRPAGQSERMEETSARIEGDCAVRTLIALERDRDTGAERPGVPLPGDPKSVGGHLLDSACKGKFAARVRDVAMTAHLLFEMTPRGKRKRPPREEVE